MPVLIDAARFYKHLGCGWGAAIDAKPVQIKGWEELDLFTHCEFDVLEPRDWRVSEGTTGNYIAAGKTRSAAITAARKLLDKVGKERMAAIIARNQEAGLSPRYRAEEAVQG